MEVEVRRALFRSGFRYRTHYPVPGSPRRSIDIAFPGYKIAIFIDGCFWHGCPEHSVKPKNNSEWWEAKLSKNLSRDSETNAVLESQGWSVLRIWEHSTVDDAINWIEPMIRSKRKR